MGHPVLLWDLMRTWFKYHPLDIFGFIIMQSLFHPFPLDSSTLAFSSSSSLTESIFWMILQKVLAISYEMARLYRGRQKIASQVWWILLLLLLITSASTCIHATWGPPFSSALNINVTCDTYLFASWDRRWPRGPAAPNRQRRHPLVAAWNSIKSLKYCKTFFKHCIFLD